jgi:hypothetical protein
MEIADLVAVISLAVSIIAVVYSFLSNTKRYELTYQYYYDILTWHNNVVEVLTDLRLKNYGENGKIEKLAKLSALIECGRFYFPNIDKNDGWGKEKPSAYKGYRNAILEFLVFEYRLFGRDDCEEYLEHAQSLQRLFTSYVFGYLNPKKLKRKIKHNTDITMKSDFTIDDYLAENPEYIYIWYPNNEK